MSNEKSPTPDQAPGSAPAPGCLPGSPAESVSAETAGDAASHLGDRHKKSAGGWPALTASLKHVLAQPKPLRSLKGLLKVNQPKGFDCPGCAWPEPDDPSAFEFCENGVKAVAWETTGKTATPAFFAKHTVAELAKQSDHELENHGRLTHPMRHDPATDTYQPITWDEAFATIGQHLKQLPDPNQAIFYTSGRTSNEAAFLYQLFARLLGTNNLPDCSNMCHESSGVALGEQIGVGKGTVRLSDFKKATAIFVMGQNPGTNHPRMLSALQDAAKRGCKIVSINPIKERGLDQFLHPQDATAMLKNQPTKLTSTWVQPRIGGDLALLLGVIKFILLAESENPGQILDHAFIETHTTGFDAFQSHVLNLPWTTLEHQSGVNRHQMCELANLYIASDNTIVCWAMGLTQHKHAVATIQMAVNLLLLKGNLGREGAGACPVRGHSNVQGDRTMGITERPTPAFNERLQNRFGFTPPTEHGHSVVDAMQAMLDGTGRFFMSMGGNFAAATPDTPRCIQALKNCDMAVHVATKFNRTHTATAKQTLLLPCLGRTDRCVTQAGAQQVTVEDSMSIVHASSGGNTPVSDQLLSEPHIVAGIAEQTFGDRFPKANAKQWQTWGQDFAAIRDAIAEVIPGFDGFNDKIKQPGGFDLGSTVRERVWTTATGKAPFVTADVPDLDLPDGQLTLMTIRSHDQYNTTIYSMDDRYRNIRGKRNIVFLNRQDMATLSLVTGDRIRIQSHFADGIERQVEGFEAVAFDLPKGCCAGYFPELNPLISMQSFADRSKTPTSKAIPISIEPMDVMDAEQAIAAFADQAKAMQARQAKKAKREAKQKAKAQAKADKQADK